MFVFYFGIVADITPPVCLAAYAGAGIARANPFQTGVTAVKLAVAAFIIPYIFIYNPILVLVDVTPLKLEFAIVTAVLGMTEVSGAMIGHFARNCYIWERLVLFVAGILLIIPLLVSSVIGIGVLGLIWFLQNQRDDDDSVKREPSLQA